MPALIIHGHFYQPPRENPRTGIIEEQPGAAPFHDWNERVHAECYAPNAAVQLADVTTGGDRVVNNYAHISFNFGPTLLGWLEQNHCDTYDRIISADRESVARHGGHGNAIAQAYGHAILPLCNERDLRTQIRWGLADFRCRFGREAESIWLPETACNDRVMSTLIDEGLRYVILAPHQAARVRTRSDSDGIKNAGTVSADRLRDVCGAWEDVNDNNIDTSIPYGYTHAENPDKSIAVFFYDGRTSRAIAFESLLRSSRDF